MDKILLLKNPSSLVRSRTAFIFILIFFFFIRAKLYLKHILDKKRVLFARLCYPRECFFDVFLLHRFSSSTSAMEEISVFVFGLVWLVCGLVNRYVSSLLCNVSNLRQWTSAPPPPKCQNFPLRVSGPFGLFWRMLLIRRHFLRLRCLCCLSLAVA